MPEILSRSASRTIQPNRDMMVADAIFATCFMLIVLAVNPP